MYKNPFRAYEMNGNMVRINTKLFKKIVALSFFFKQKALVNATKKIIVIPAYKNDKDCSLY